ncbi:MAG: hypothetical protein AAFY46_04255 [Planctomycetota bacterium]
MNIPENDLVPIVAVSAGCGVVVIWMLLTMITTIFSRGQVEKSRREIAAYVAEGSMTPDEGERLLKAGADGAKAC